LVRAELTLKNILSTAQVRLRPHGSWVNVAGLVLIRQRPGTAKGIVFETLEDETGIVNIIIRPEVYERCRAAARHAAFLQVEGNVERHNNVQHIMAVRLTDLSESLAGYQFRSRDFH
jgi:error-prone DNA polymerase